MTSTQERYLILAAIAFDETGERALWEGARQAQVHDGAELHVVHVAASVSDSTSEASIQPISDALRARVQRLQVQTPLKVTAHIRTGSAPRAILQTAADLDADLVIVGTHKRAGVQKLVLGSVAELVLRDAHCPVLVAMPKDYLLASQTDTIEPVCPDCAIARQNSANATYWCERHSRSRHRPHVYEPAGSHRAGPLEL